MPLQWFFTGRDGKRVGPCTPQRLKQMASEGRLLPADKFRKEGTEEPSRERDVRRPFPPPTV